MYFIVHAAFVRIKLMMMMILYSEYGKTSRAIGQSPVSGFLESEPRHADPMRYHFPWLSAFSRSLSPTFNALSDLPETRHSCKHVALLLNYQAEQHVDYTTEK